jgi:hypothetical protein
MKKTTQRLTWTAMILLLVSYVAIGCKTAPSKTLAQSVASIQAPVKSQTIFYTVESAQAAWVAARVKGEITMDQDTEVTRREVDYYNAVTHVRSTLVKWQDKPEAGPYWDAAMKDVNSAAAKYVALVNSYLSDKKSPPQLNNPPMPK